MGVVHLARRGDGDRVALKVLRPHIVGDDEARRRLAREVGSLQPGHEQVGRRDRRRRPVGADPVRRHPLRARAVAARPRARGGADRRAGPALVRRLPRRGGRLGARGRRPAPRREAVQRADGGPHPDPHRLRPGPGGRRPEAHPHRLAARHPGLPRARDPVRRRRDRRLRRALVGRDRRLRRDRPAAVRPRAVDGDHGPGPPRRARPHRACPTPLRQLLAAALDPEPAAPARRSPSILGWLRPQVAPAGAPRRRRCRRSRTS